ncbi:hypothetical protein PHMEG_00017147 [Phytophthora megakarya]|uniref:Reverse transcriptase/retrotransposon-derived protein RNase H-like domain-containing protein n=1 Tax=Phytophthora megakarya TaxID=4795 RepID=A0A225VX84_9STRA|nr:hypothetical protein PHMEG_00017147 [Phytophthora megakarya]
MRTALPAFNKLTAPLVNLMEKTYERVGGRKNFKREQLSWWSDDEAACVQRCKYALQNVLLLAHPDPEKLLTVYTDASDEHWGTVITQIAQSHATPPVSEQEHEPFMITKVGYNTYAMVETFRRADYLLHRLDGIALFTDHRNLCYIVDPHSVSSSVPKYRTDKLHRWALLLMRYQYEIHDIAGDENVWTDLLSRLSSSFKTICAIWQVPLPLSTHLDDGFVGPTQQEIAAVQNAAAAPTDHSRIWIPDDVTDLQVCVRFGISGHRGAAVTSQKIGEIFVWAEVKKGIDYFVKRSLHCSSTVGGPPLPRVLGETMYADWPNELLH